MRSLHSGGFWPTVIGGTPLALLSVHCSSPAGSMDGNAPPTPYPNGSDAAADTNAFVDVPIPDASGSLDIAVPEDSYDASGSGTQDALAVDGSDGSALPDGTGDGQPGPQASYKPCPPAGTPCAIMPLGDSITFGYNSSTGGGYRLQLLRRIRAAGHDATFAGDNSTGPATLDGKPFPKNNEGFSGYTIDNAPSLNPPRQGISPLAAPALKKYSPNVVLLMIGTNDVGTQNDLAHAPNRLASLLDVITSTSPKALLIVAQITPPGDAQSNARAQAYNAAIAGLVQSRADAGQHIAVVDMYSAITANPSYATQWMNGLHPNDAGYDVLGNAWYAALAPHL